MKAGALSKNELLAVWRSAVDPSYAQALERAGDGNGFEVPSQGAEVYARVSKAIEVSSQALYILPWSGQTEEPASGEAKATVTLTFARTKRIEAPLVLGAGTRVEEETTDWGENEGVTVRTGRRYVLIEDLVFHPGEAGPFDVVAEAERPGWGYNNPLPETLRAIVQPGNAFTNDLATLDVAIEAPSAALPYSRAKLTSENQPDMPIPEHVGQYFLFIDGLNTGHLGRVIFFERPDPAANKGSAVDIEITVSMISNTFTGDPEAGETVSFDNGADPVGYGRLLGARDVGGERRLTVRVLNGAPGSRVAGLRSGFEATGAQVTYGPQNLASEAPVGGVGGSSWRVLDWATDFGLSVRNADKPAGGRLGVLDAHGEERGIPRGPFEEDSSYRRRVAEVADTVAPNAIRRTLNRTAGGYAWKFTEAADLGFFFDGTGEPPSATPGRELCDAFDTDVLVYSGALASGVFQFQEPCVVDHPDGSTAAHGYVGNIGGGSLTLIRRAGRPIGGGGFRVRGLHSGAIFNTSGVTVPASVEDRRYRRWLDYEQFRAFFLVSLQRIALDDFGFAYDAGDAGAYDIGGHDGFPRGNAAVYRRIWQAVNSARAGGVGFDFEQFDVAGSGEEDGLMAVATELSFLANVVAAVDDVAWTRIGSREVDVSLFPATIGPYTRRIRFDCAIEKTVYATSAEIRLMDVTDPMNHVLVDDTDFTSTSDTNEEFVSPDLVVGSNDGEIRDDRVSIYELQLRRTGGTPPDAAAICTSARLVVYYV